MGRKSTDETESNGRIKILETSAEIFAEKGFDGARVDEIAKRAGVNKALIYYHFESKDKILEELFNNYINDMIRRKQELINQTESLDFNHMDKYITENLSFLKNNGSEIMKIAMVEALKNNKQNDSLFRMMDLFFNGLTPLWNKVGLNPKDGEITSDLLINAFFFGMAPVILYVILGEKWAEYYKIGNEELDKQFAAALNEVYVKSIMNSIFENKK